MSEKDDVHLIDGNPVHPVVAMATRIAARLYASRTSAITAAEFQELFNSAVTNKHWSDYDIGLRTAALMVATALQLQAELGPAAALSTAASPLDPATAQASAHAQRTMEAARALGALADQFGGGARA